MLKIHFKSVLLSSSSELEYFSGGCTVSAIALSESFRVKDKSLKTKGLVKQYAHRQDEVSWDQQVLFSLANSVQLELFLADRVTSYKQTPSGVLSRNLDTYLL